VQECIVPAGARDPTTGVVQPDPVKFPHGLADLAAYFHSKGLKAGIYTDGEEAARGAVGSCCFWGVLRGGAGFACCVPRFLAAAAGHCHVPCQAGGRRAAGVGGGRPGAPRCGCGRWAPGGAAQRGRARQRRTAWEAPVASARAGASRGLDARQQHAAWARSAARCCWRAPSGSRTRLGLWLVRVFSTSC
jgi:hypothetical protein